MRRTLSQRLAINIYPTHDKVDGKLTVLRLLLVP